MAKAVLDELKADRPKRQFTVGIFDDVTSLSLPWDRDFRPPRPAGEVQAVFFRLGSDGTVGAKQEQPRRSSSTRTDNFVQGYFVYDSKKSGRHDRFAPPIRTRAHQLDLPRERRRLRRPAISSGCSTASTSSMWQETARSSFSTALTGPLRCGTGLPGKVQRQLQDKHIQFWVVDANKVRGRGPARQPDQHSDAAVLLRPFREYCQPTRRWPRSRPRSPRPTASGVTPSWTATSPPSTRRLPTSSRWRFPKRLPLGGSIGVAVPNRPRTSSST